MLPGFGAAQAATSGANAYDVTQLPIEQLLDTEFIPASRIARQISDAPSAVSIVTAQDIRDYGYRSLSEVLQSMRGLYVTSSLFYDTLGGRGLSYPDDYVGRIMLVIDGVTINDNVFNQIFIGRDGLVDVGLIDRVEFIPGPGSTTYGNNAFLGVISVTTKRGRDHSGAQVAVGFGNESQSQRSQRLTYGKQFDNGADVLLSVSRYADAGRDINLPTLVGMENYTFQHLKQADNHRLFFKGGYDGWTLEAASAKHTMYSSSFFGNWDPAEAAHQDSSHDDNSFVSLKKDAQLGANLNSSSHVYFGQYLYSANNRLPDAITGVMTDYLQTSTGRWWGGDFKFVGTWFDRHTVLFGAEYRNDYVQRLTDNSVSDMPLFDTAMRTTSVYVQDEYRLLDTLAITPGFRYDDNSVNGSAFSPRFAAVYRPWQSSTFKFSSGRAFRYRNLWEESYSAGTELTQNKQEVVTSNELVWQEQLTGKSRLTLSVYRNVTSHAVARFFETMKTNGQEIGLEHITDGDTRMSASYVRQRSVNDRGPMLFNNPRWLGKLNIAQPLFQHRATAGLAVQSIGPRRVTDGSFTSTNTLANLTLSSNRLIENADVSLSVRNIFNQQYQDVVDPFDLPGFKTLPRSGRNLWLQLEYTIK